MYQTLECLIQSSANLTLMTDMFLIQILLPLYDNNGNSFPNDYYIAVKEELTQNFGGVTMFSRAPAVGVWKDADKNIHDEIIIFEVMLEEIQASYWKLYKQQLQKQFLQDTIIIRSSKIDIF